MTPSLIQPIVLCGGSGTRLWPLSRKALPKQFAPLVGDTSLLALTLQRLKGLSMKIDCIAAEEHRFQVKEAMERAGVSGHQILEPVARNTAAAMAAAALHAHSHELLLFAPADHHIPDAELFERTVQRGVPAALAGRIVTFGVAPSFASTAYGYIEAGDAADDGNSHLVRRFVEKPDADTARALLAHGGHCWNAGILLVRPQVLLDALALHAPDILAACRKASAAATVDGSFHRLDKDCFAACRSESIDYAVLEKHEGVAMVRFEGEWSDVGSWNAVAALHAADAQGNRLNGQASVLGASNTFVHAPHRPVVALGTHDLLIVDTPDALLVADAGCAEKVADVVRLLASEGRPEATEHRRVVRPWGAYDILDIGSRFQVKRLTVKPGAKLSLQMHHHRAEHWIVVQGVARATCDGQVSLVRENESIYLPSGAMHRLENPGRTMLEVIEVQTGGYLGEDDIIRFDDTYGRCAALRAVAADAPLPATTPVLVDLPAEMETVLPAAMAAAAASAAARVAATTALPGSA